ncbi:MAG: hypothetical protein JJU02_01340 [Cryomorphaceae bacterium]|nr:hypothetical protein [Cryomorphaceae bacterium]
MNFRLLFDVDKKDIVREEVLPLVEDIVSDQLPIVDALEGALKEGDCVLTYASDNQLKELLTVFAEKKITLGILPHPNARAICTGLGVDYNLQKAINFLKKQEKPQVIDVMYCNDRPVFNNLIIGHAFQLAAAKPLEKTGFFMRMRKLFQRFSRLHPFQLNLETADGKKLKTAASGVIIVQHGRSTLLSRLVLQNSFINDGMLHALLISPRSVSGLMLFAIRSWWEEKRLPPYAAHIKTNALTLDCPESFEFAEDGITLSAKSLQLEVRKKH